MWPFKKKPGIGDVVLVIDGKDFYIAELLEDYRYKSYLLKRYQELCQKHGIKLEA